MNSDYEPPRVPAKLDCPGISISIMLERARFYSPVQIEDYTPHNATSFFFISIPLP